MLSSRIALSVCLSAGLLSACAADRVDFGGLMNPVMAPSNAVACADSGWSIAHQVEPEFPRSLFTILYMNQDASATRTFEFGYDIDETGSPVNIRFLRPTSYLRHRAMQRAILSGAEALAQARYETTLQPVYATGCRVVYEFNYDIDYWGAFY